MLTLSGWGAAPRPPAMDEGFGRIRQYACNNNERLRDISAAIVSGAPAPLRLTSGD